jgi:transcription initiation factor IIE alpha subunit
VEQAVIDAQKKDARLAADMALLRVFEEITEPVTATRIAEITGIRLKAVRPSLNRLRKLDLIKRTEHTDVNQPHLWEIIK